MAKAEPGRLLAELGRLLRLKAEPGREGLLRSRRLLRVPAVVICLGCLVGLPRWSLDRDTR